MGKATELYDRLAIRQLSAAELARRRAAVELGGDDVRVTEDGRLVRQSRPSEQLAPAQPQTWD